MQELKQILSSNLDRMAREFRELRGHIEELERELHRLREENERLRRRLQERSSQERERGREIRVRREVKERREIEGRRENREREDRERPRERDEGRAREERPRSEREVALHQIEVMRIALHGLREAERGDVVEMLTLAIRSREMMLEGRRDEEAQRVRERAPNRGQLAEILSMASKLWREFGNTDKSVAVGRLAEQLSGSKERQVREHEQREIRRRRVERREE
jgi:regulator of replication initiation timing